MRLITDCGRRLDRQAELAALIHRAKGLPYGLLADGDRQKIKVLLDLEHMERERMRWGDTPRR